MSGTSNIHLHEHLAAAAVLFTCVLFTFYAVVWISCATLLVQEKLPSSLPPSKILHVTVCCHREKMGLIHSSELHGKVGSALCGSCLSTGIAAVTIAVGLR